LQNQEDFKNTGNIGSGDLNASESVDNKNGVNNSGSSEPSGNVGGLGTDEGDGEETGSGTGSARLSDTEFPLVTEISNGGTVDFVFNGSSYTIKVWWDEVYYVKSELKSGDRVIRKIYYPYGENRETGFLTLGNVNFFDTDNNSIGDIFFKHILGTELSSVKIKISNEIIEICGDRTDNDRNGLTDCQEEECKYAAGSVLGLTNYQCNWPSEYFCEDNFDNDADGSIDINDSSCVGYMCDLVDEIYYFVVWSYMPEESLTSNPVRKGCCPFIDTSSPFKTCINAAGDCILYDTYYETSAGNSYYICGDNHNWDRCGPLSGGTQVNKYPGNYSDGGRCICKQIGSVYTWFCS
jgi:hypothetical protein